MKSVLERIRLVDFPDDQYFKEDTPKKQIYLHHTAGNSSPYQVVDYWTGTPDRIATSIIIGGAPPKGVTSWYDGQIVQAFSSRYWGYHLGVKQATIPAGGPSSVDLQKHSIGIEICNWGWVTKQTDGSFKNYVNRMVSEKEVIELAAPYRGYKYWHSYTDAQIQSTRDLLVLLCAKWNIPKEFKGMGMFDINTDALMGKPGIWSHTSVRSDKVDVYPHPKLVQMLKSL